MTVSDIERTPEILPASAAPGRRLEEIWKTEPGLAGWFSTVDHKKIGKRYIVTALIFLVLGGVEALVMRVQLARPNQQLLTPEQYNQLFSTHGMTMIFLYALPILSGFSNYLWPLILITSRSQMTLPLGLHTYMNDMGFEWGPLMAATVVFALPVVFLFTFIQSRLVRGLGAGAGAVKF